MKRYEKTLKRSSPAVFVVGENEAFVFDASDRINVFMP